MTKLDLLIFSVSLFAMSQLDTLPKMENLRVFEGYCSVQAKK